MSKKKKSERLHVSIQMADVVFTVNGVEHRTPPVNYTRTEYEDGTVEEQGTPPAGTLGEVVKAITANPNRRKQSGGQ